MQKSLNKRLVKYIPQPTWEIFEKFTAAKFEIWLVGGGVRNLLQKTAPTDCDFTTNATPSVIQALFKDSFYDNQFGTVSVPIINSKGQKEIYEITPYRSEKGYQDHRHPDKVKWETSLDKDLGRRDFTFNAVVIGPDPQKPNIAIKNRLQIIDLFNGLQDFKNKIIKAVGNPDQRFTEDPLRMMRAIRFASQLAFYIEKETLSAIQKNSDLINQISKERIRNELFKILKSNYPADGIKLLISSGIMQHIIPEINAMHNIPQAGHHIYDVLTHSIESLRACPSSDPIIRFACLLHDIGKPQSQRFRCPKCGWVFKEKKIQKYNTLICPRCQFKTSKRSTITFYNHEVIGAQICLNIAKRLRLSKKDTQRLTNLVRHHMFTYDPKMTDAAIRRFIRKVGREQINDMMMLRVGDRIGGGSKSTSWRLQELQKRIGQVLYTPMSTTDLKINGHDVIKTLHIPPGPVVGQILKQLFDEVMQDSSKNTRSYLLSKMQEIHQSRSQQDKNKTNNPLLARRQLMPNHQQRSGCKR